MKRLACVLLSLLVVSAALAQEATPTVAPTPAPPIPVTLDPADARSATCTASTLPDFVPYVVRPGDHLAGLIAGISDITVTQLALLNCLDDPDALPVGAVIWLPAPPSASASQATTEPTSEATAAPTEAATAEATPEATAEPGSASIERFSASADSVLNTDTVTFSWAAQGSAAYLYPCLTDTCQRPQSAAALPLTASLLFTNYQYAGSYRYRLDVDGANASVTRDVSIQVACAQAWLGGVGASPLCPSDPPLTVMAVWQPFEHGVMIWFSDTKQIFVMTGDGRAHVYEDKFVDGDPSPTEPAPNERFTPRRGFGLLWEGLGGADSSLGWGLAAETGYDSARQAAGHTSYTTYVAGPDKIVYAITQLPGVAAGYWTQVAG